jgi:uncharacterized membrane protein YphA (DoxX/SURF4 family)
MNSNFFLRLLHFPPFLLLVGVLPALIAYRLMDRESRPPIWVHTLRWILGLLFAFSGFAKLIPGFPNTMGPVNLEAALAPHGLALFARFVAVSEVAVGLLLLTRRFATLAALMLFPMLLSILVATVSMQWRGTPYVNTGFLLLNLALLLYDYPKLLPLLGERSAENTLAAVLARHKSHCWWILGMGGLLGTLGALRIGPQDTLTVALLCGLILVLLYMDLRTGRRPA